ncbi:hypothetical protein [Azospirillum canadense]|uniref:hypothetical protein n=1 Tax=Azospirillum canadense TaxID=403962 RepID=UPI00222708D3|nr:hypothetical protein [Azospirillum canadense]MCW2242913.1 hypothetical protein [Azospirillum canadense]
MAKKTIFAVGLDLPDVEGLECIGITDYRSLLDADIVAFRADMAHFSAPEEYNGKPLISSKDSANVVESKNHWRKQLSAAYEHGKTVVIFMTEKNERYYYTGRMEWSGTGKNSRGTNIVDQIDSTAFIPLKFDELTFASGSSMILSSAAEPVSIYWKEFEAYSSYECYFKHSKVKPMVLTKSANAVVGAMLRGAGTVYMMPDINWDVDELSDYNEKDEDWYWNEDGKRLAYKFRDALLDIDRKSRKDAETTPEPAWAQEISYRLAQESDIESSIAKITVEIDDLATKRQVLRDELVEVGNLRHLLYEKGKGLEVAIRRALAAMGFDAQSFKDEDSEFDAVFASKEGRFIGEVEGKDNKQINIDKHSQLQRNISEDFAKEGIEDMAVGVLFGNAYRLMPVSERGDFFTEKVHKASAQIKTALVRTPDLFPIAKYLLENEDEEFAEACRKSILEGVGGVVKFPPVPQQEVKVGEADASE